MFKVKDIKNTTTIIIKFIENYSNIIDFYIGQADNPKRRLKEHYKTKKFIQMIVLYFHDNKTIDYLEKTIINYFYNNHNNMNYQNYSDYNVDKKEIFRLDTEKNDYLYIAFQSMVEIDKKYEEYYLYIKDNDPNNIICFNDELNICKDKNNKVVSDPFENSIQKINKLIMQNKIKYKNMYIGKCDNYQNIKHKHYINDGVSLNSIKRIYKCNNIDIINNLRYELTKYYKNQFNIILSNPPNFYNKLFHGGSNNCIYVYFK
jgi:hypothetical protein